MRILLDLLLPPQCPGCGYEGTALCTACRAELHRRRHEPSGAPVGLPVAMPHGLLQLEWCATYSGPVRDAIHALKYRGERRLVEPIADALASRWAGAGAGGDLVTWVPVHESRRRERGFDQAELLARRTAELLGMPALPSLLRRRRTEAQHALGREERADNTTGVFAILGEARPRLVGRWPIVIDDVMTTGATLSGCASALHTGGVAAVSALTVARDR